MSFFLLLGKERADEMKFRGKVNIMIKSKVSTSMFSSDATAKTHVKGVVQTGAIYGSKSQG